MIRKTFFLLIFVFIIGCSSVDKYETPSQVNSSLLTATLFVESSPTSTLFPPSTQEPTFEPIISISPDNNWKSIGFSEWEVQSIVSQDGKTRWEFENTPEKYGWFDWSYAFYRWSAQSNFVYLTIHPRIDGFAPFFQGSGLYKFNLSNGTMSEILSGQAPNLTSFALSPDENLLAYKLLSESALFLNIRNIEMEVDEKEISITGYNDAGYILWSPSQDRLVFTVSRINGTEWQPSLAMVNLQNNTTVILYDNKQMLLRPREWLSDNEILVSGLVSSDESLFTFNLETKELKNFKKFSPTP